MFRRVLVANRGEIAVRVLRALRELGIEGVAVYSDADAEAPFAKAADVAVRLGPADPNRSYLNADRILAVAKRTGAEAIHPGYGFLSENAGFAKRVQDEGLAWIGPGPAAMQAVGDKVPARRLAQEHGVPVAPGSPGVLRDAQEAAQVADKIGYPVLLKASGGGGGIGMRVVRRASEMPAQFEAAKSTAVSAFGNGDVFLEKYIERPRHIELQVIGDGKGRVVQLGERECSIQRRHQKLLEEAPSPALDDAQRKQLGDLGVRFMQAVGYANAGTLEFLYEGGKFYFNEVNARLQVEHPVTEMVTGLDLVQAQIQVAAGEGLPFSQNEVQRRGHAIEVRLNAEDPLRDFLPTPGPLRRWQMPNGEGIRLDSGVREGWRVPGQYDSLLAKLVAWGKDRAQAVARLDAALHAARIEGTPTNLGFHRATVRNAKFLSGDLSTRFLEEERVVEGLRAAHAQSRGRALLVAAALATAPRGGAGLVFHRTNRPRRLTEADA